MRFKVGPWVYKVRVTDGPLHNQDGEECRGLCVFAEREILLSGLLPSRQRIDTLMHELRHAWRHHMGAPVDEESDCNASATFSVSMMRQLQAQGGEPALMRLTAAGVAEASPDAAAVVLGAECAKCGGRFSPLQVHTGRATMDRDRGVLFVRRSLECDFCGHVQIWDEVATQAGLPTGQVAAGPQFLTGTAAAEYRRLSGAA